MNVRKLTQLTVFDDPCLGRVSILGAPAAAERLVVLKEQRCPGEAAFRAYTAQLLRRQSLHSPFLPELLGSDVRGDGAARAVRAFFDYSPLQLSHLRLRKVEGAMRLVRDLLSAAAFLQRHKMVHGDIRPELIAFYPQSGGFKLAEKLRSTPDPRVAQRKNLARGAELFLCPRYFHELAHGSARKSHADLLKNESFAIGLVALRSFYPCCVSRGQFFLPRVQVFDVAGLEQTLEALLLHAHSPLECAFIAFLRRALLCPNDSERLGPADALAELERLAAGGGAGWDEPVEFEMNRELKQRLAAFPGWCEAKSFAELGHPAAFHPLFGAAGAERVPSLVECIASPKRHRREFFSAGRILSYAPVGGRGESQAEEPASPATRALFRTRLISERVFRRHSPTGDALVIRLSAGDFNRAASPPAPTPKRGPRRAEPDARAQNCPANLAFRFEALKHLPGPARAFSPSASAAARGT